MARRKSRYSGIGGQAVLEGVMMKNKEKYAVAVRKPDGEIEVEVETYQGLAHGSKIKELPFIRGIFNFLDSLLLGTRALNYSASFYLVEWLIVLNVIIDLGICQFLESNSRAVRTRAAAIGSLS